MRVVTYPADTREERTAAKRRVLRRNKAPHNFMAAAAEMSALPDPSTSMLTLSIVNAAMGHSGQWGSPIRAWNDMIGRRGSQSEWGAKFEFRIKGGKHAGVVCFIILYPD